METSAEPGLDMETSAEPGLDMETSAEPGLDMETSAEPGLDMDNATKNEYHIINRSVFNLGYEGPAINSGFDPPTQTLNYDNQFASTIVSLLRAGHL